MFHTKTALHLAAEHGHSEAVEVLLDHNASIDCYCWVRSVVVYMLMVTVFIVP